MFSAVKIYDKEFTKKTSADLDSLGSVAALGDCYCMDGCAKESDAATIARTSF